MNKKVTVLTFCAVLFAMSVPAEAQQPAKIPRIGFLAAGSAPTASTRMETFRQGLRALGYVEGKDIVIEYRNAGAGSIKFRTMLPNWFVSRWTSLSRRAQPIRVPPRKQRARFQLL